MSHTEPDGKVVRSKVTRDIRSPRDVHSPGIVNHHARKSVLNFIMVYL